MKAARIIEQGMGRSVRGEKDYSVIVLTGNHLIRSVRTRDARKYFSNQARKQIEIGMEIADMAKDEMSLETSSMLTIKGIIAQCLRRDDGWKEFYIEKMN